MPLRRRLLPPPASSALPALALTAITSSTATIASTFIASSTARAVARSSGRSRRLGAATRAPRSSPGRSMPWTCKSFGSGSARRPRPIARSSAPSAARRSRPHAARAASALRSAGCGSTAQHGRRLVTFQSSGQVWAACLVAGLLAYRDTRLFAFPGRKRPVFGGLDRVVSMINWTAAAHAEVCKATQPQAEP